ncbi:MAG: heavy-metal-associated domain-containing protein [Cytophagales bacterium]
MKTVYLFVALLLTIAKISAQSETTTVKFKVLGNCEMCKKTIENSLAIKGVKSANWNQETKMIQVVYSNSKISELKIHESIAAAGYETEKMKASTKAYADLPECCQYSQSK